LKTFTSYDKRIVIICLFQYSKERGETVLLDLGALISELRKGRRLRTGNFNFSMVSIYKYQKKTFGGCVQNVKIKRQ
jgi:hypothetical protein